MDLVQPMESLLEVTQTGPRVEQMPQLSPRVTDFLAKDPDFIKARFRIGKFIIDAVNIQAGQADL
jgi:hypothetical protein